MKYQFHSWLKRVMSFQKKRKVIIQFSPPRSGSTLVFNILRELFPEYVIKKVHNLPPNHRLWPVIVTYRHPLDCIASIILRDGLEPTDEVIEQTIRKFDGKVWDILQIKEGRRVLMLRYEDFVYEYDYIYEHFEKFFRMKISPLKKLELTNRYQINAVEKMTENYGAFAEYNHETHLHGKHI